MSIELSTTFSDQLKELIDWHVSEMEPPSNGDCGCVDEEIHDWANRLSLIGNQAYADHVHEKILELVRSHYS